MRRVGNAAAIHHGGERKHPRPSLAYSNEGHHANECDLFWAFFYSSSHSMEKCVHTLGKQADADTRTPGIISRHNKYSPLLQPKHHSD